jgi:hypothetical protein
VDVKRLCSPSNLAKGVILVAAVLAGALPGNSRAVAGELPVVHLRKTITPPPVVRMIQDPATASAWYSASPTWFGQGGKTGDRDHTEILVTYDDAKLYVAFITIDRSPALFPAGSSRDKTTTDSNALWIETPQGRRFYVVGSVNNGYPPGVEMASGEFPSTDFSSKQLTGISSAGWQAAGKSFEWTVSIPWAALGATAPAPGSRWRANFVTYNQTSPSLTASTVIRQPWAPGSETRPDQWGWLTFDVPQTAVANEMAAEAALTLRPATGYGEEVTLRAGVAADQGNQWNDCVVTESDWNDWDVTEYTIKAYYQFDLSMVPRDRKILSATLENHLRGNFNGNPTDQWLHVMRLAGPYDPRTVTFRTAPPPVENGARSGR